MRCPRSIETDAYYGWFISYYGFCVEDKSGNLISSTSTEPWIYFSEKYFKFNIFFANIFQAAVVAIKRWEKTLIFQ